MRLAALLHSRVVDVDGRIVGKVHDVRLVQDGPILDGFGAALRVDGLVVGASGDAIRLGYHRRRVGGPFLIKVLARAIEARSRVVPWESVEWWDGQEVVLRCR